MVKVRVSNIEWDTEVNDVIHDVQLPSEMTVEVDAAPDEPIEVIEELALDAVSSRTGWCIFSSTVTILE